MNGLFFVTSKLVGGLARAETLFILLLVISFFALRRGRAGLAKRALGVALLGMLVLTVLPVGDLLLAPLEARYPAAPKLTNVTAIILLGGAEDVDPSIRWRQPNVAEGGDRYLAALSLAQRFPKAELFFAGGSGRLLGAEVSEASIASAIFHNAGIAPARLHLEGASRNTAENAALLRKLANGQSAGETVLVTSAAHMPRAMSTFCAAGWSRLIAWPTDYRSGNFADGIGWRFTDHLAAINLGIDEWIGLLAYRLTGRTRALFEANCSVGPSAAVA
jgi:uncharacterized SAM-binding protein YcdF (DUF218 family)